MKRKVILSLLLSAMWAAAVAQDAATQRLVVWQKGGEKVYFNLTEEPETTFEDGQLIIKTTSTTVYYLLENVLRYTYEGTMTAIQAPDARPGDIVFHQGNNQMTFEGLPEGAVVSVYTLDGKLLTTQRAISGRQTVVSLANQPAGTYLVKAGGVTYKFMKR